MLESHLQLLRCPSCASGIDVLDMVERRGRHLQWAVLSCECSRNHAVLDGIVLISHPDDPRADEASACLRTTRAAVLPQWLGEAMRRWSPELPPLAREESGIRALTEAGGGLFYEYLAYRTATRSYATGMALVAQADEGLFVDVGCGIGHFTYAREQQYGGETVAIDYCFPLLHMGRQLGFLSPDSFCVCTDAATGLPIRSGRAGVVLISDGLHYFRDQPTLLRESRRVLVPTGSLLLNHLHNAERPVQEPAQGFSRAPDEYVCMLTEAGFDSVQTYSDQRIIDSIARGDRLVVSEHIALSRLRTLSVIASPRDARPALNLAECSLATRAGLNPIYRPVEEGRTKARLSWPSEYFKGEHRSELFVDEVEWTSGGSDERQELSRRLVWVCAPPGFLEPH